MARRVKGEGTLVERKDGRFELRIAIDGKKKSFYGKTPSEAKSAKDKYVREKKNAQKTTVYFEEFILNWLHNVKQHELKPSSYDRLESTIANKVIPALGFYEVEEIDSDLLQSELINYYAKKEKSYSSIKKIYDAVNSCFSWAVTARKIEFNPMDGVSKVTPKNYDVKEISVMNSDEIAKIEESVKSKYSTGKFIYSNGYGILMIIYTGLRIGEALGVKWSDFDKKHRLLSITRNVQMVKDRGDDGKNYKILIQDDLKTLSGKRVLPLDDDAMRVIEAISEIKIGHKPTDFILGDKNGNPWRGYYFQKMLDSVLEGCDISHHSAHDLRHTYATRMLEKGVDIKEISLLLGHTSVKITYDTYIHFVNLHEAKKKAVLLSGKAK